jgi:hypothetical protein
LNSLASNVFGGHLSFSDTASSFPLGGRCEGLKGSDADAIPILAGGNIGTPELVLMTGFSVDVTVLPDITADAAASRVGSKKLSPQSWRARRLPMYFRRDSIPSRRKMMPNIVARAIPVQKTAVCPPSRNEEADDGIADSVRVTVV